MIWRIPSLTFDASPNSLSAVSPKLVVNMDGLDIITAIDVCITKRKSDVQMDGYRRGFKEFEAMSNKVWTWAAASFLFYLPFEFNFAQVFDEFVNAIKWIKVVHGLKRDPFPPNAPLPSDIRIIFKEARIELEDDPFENLLQMSHELKEDEVVTTMLASPDPYNTTETVEICWDEFGLDWMLGEIRIRCGLRVFMRTASRYDDSRILFLPDLKLRVLLDWICSGDPHDHHSVTLCAPHRLPHYSTDHDSYRAFRSSSLDLSLTFDVAAGAGNGDTGDRLPHVLLKVNVSLNFPKFYITYWMSHSSDYGFRVISDGLNLMAAMKLSVQAASEQGSWTAQNRDACISIADGVHRAHLLRRILSNDALKILKLHMEEESQPSGNPQMTDGTASTQDQGSDPRGHRRGYSMSDQNQSLLTQLIGEASTKLVAHCEQTDAIEETGVPKVEQERGIGGEETGVDCVTLKHNMLEATSNSEQYEMVVDIVNNLVLFVDPKKKELAERRRKLRFACQMTDMKEMRERIIEQQCELREIVSVVRSLERQLFYLDTQSNGNVDEQKRRDIVEEMEDIKAKQLEVSDKLAIYIR
ncbi:hypothetical protein ANCCEY_14541 [Ancylostoma ceylanicum]|uniref:DUF2405 domain-containing protein n=1 Tax=Ancylostoma ceylanicum TaxID=53326 RepID=A0A0D6L6D5_9BILA|nr:hypothetical protein ANCCEY_14541 [Ancylostoma ceylanicum]